MLAAIVRSVVKTSFEKKGPELKSSWEVLFPVLNLGHIFFFRWGKSRFNEVAIDAFWHSRQQLHTL